MGNKREHEIRFYGEGMYDTVITHAHELMTIRSRAKGLKPGEIVDAKFSDGPDDALRIVNEVEQPIKDMHPGLLLLDGFLNPGAVTQMLEKFYADKGPWTPESVAARTLIVPQGIAQGFSGAEQMRAFYSEAYYGKPDFELDLVTDVAFDTLFFPAFYHWLVDFHHFPDDQYPAELQARELVTADRAQGMLELLRLTRLAMRQRGEKAKQNAVSFYHHFKIGDTPEDMGIR